MDPRARPNLDVFRRAFSPELLTNTFGCLKKRTVTRTVNSPGSQVDIEIYKGHCTAKEHNRLNITLMHRRFPART